MQINDKTKYFNSTQCFYENDLVGSFSQAWKQAKPHVKKVMFTKCDNENQT